MSGESLAMDRWDSTHGGLRLRPFWTGTKRRPKEAKWDMDTPPAEAMECACCVREESFGFPKIRCLETLLQDVENLSANKKLRRSSSIYLFRAFKWPTFHCSILLLSWCYRKGSFFVATPRKRVYHDLKLLASAKVGWLLWGNVVCTMLLLDVVDVVTFV